MKRLIKQNGLGQMYLDDLQEDIVTAYHGTSAENYYSILENGLINGGGTSYQKNNWGTIPGIWVTLKKNTAVTYAKQATEGYKSLGNEDEFTGYGVVFEFQVNKQYLSDEDSGVMHNFKCTCDITPDILKSGHAYIINIDDNSEYQDY